MNALRTRASWAASACVAAAHAAGASVIIPDQPRPALQALADHVHEYAVLVTAGADETGVSGVLIGDGLVLTELRAVVSQDLRGVVVKEDIRVVAAGARVAARMIAAAPDANVAVLQLAAGADSSRAPALAAGPAEAGDPLLAVRASLGGPATILYDAVEVRIEPGTSAGEPPRMRAALPAGFAGAPVFDARGDLAGLNVMITDTIGVLIPAEALRRLIARVHAHPGRGFNPG